MKRLLLENWRFWGTKPDGTVLGPLKATIPGHVHTDLQKQGVIPDQFWRDTTLEYQWIEQCGFTYECEFDYIKASGDGGEYLVFEGIDTVSSVYLNGQIIGKTSNMHIRYEFPANEVLIGGKNILRVDIMPIPEYLLGKDVTKYMSLFSQDRVFVRRMQCTFGWDWVHRMVSYGIWQPVYLISKAGGHIENVFVRTIEINSQFAALEWEAEVSHCDEGDRVSAEIRDAEGTIVYAGEAAVAKGSARKTLSLEDARLWWPNGSGEQYLYTLTARVCGKELSCHFGIRTVAVEEIPDEIGSSYTVVINGERIFAKGGNWVPADPFPSSISKQKYDHLIRLMREGNMNMLRVWGGGIYERPEFWDACDRMGIMVSLDFMMACAAYPEKEGWFMEAMEAEASAVVKELRNHPSLIFYNGDNELAMNSNLEDDYDGKRTSALVTMPTVQRLDPSRPYFSTSPFRGRPFNSPTHGDCHISAWYDPAYVDLDDMCDYRKRIDEGYGRFLSECAVAGAPPMNSLLKMMTMEDICAEDGKMWEFHTKNNPYNGYEAITHYRMIEKCARKLFGGWENINQKVRKMEYVQYEFTRLQIENYRRRKFMSSGMLFWMYNDCWPAIGWSLVDYYGQPKAGYFGSKKAFAPILVSLENTPKSVFVWVVNDTFADLTAEIEFSCVTTDGQTLFADRISAAVKANSAFRVKAYAKGDIGIVGHENAVVLYACAKEDGAVIGETECIDCMPLDLHMPCANVKVEWMPTDGKHGTLTLGTDHFARIVTVEGDLVLSDNYFDLMPGRSKTVGYTALADARVDVMPVVTWQNS